MEKGVFVHSEKIKPKLASEQADMNDLKRYLILVFGSFREASQVAGISESRLHQLFISYKIPRKTEIIRRLANAWNVDLIILTKIFEKKEVRDVK